MNKPRLLGCVLALACAIAPAGAQSDTGTVSKDLALLMVRMINDGYSIGPNASLTSGIAPSLASQVGTPPGGKILGTLIWQNGADIMGIAPGNLDVVRTWFGNDFIKRGYTAATNDFVSQYGGFRDPVTGPAAGYCGNNASYTISGRYRDQTTTEFRIRVAPSFGLCASRAQGGMSNPAMRNAPLLYNPPLAERATRCASSGGMGSTGTESGVATSMPPADIFAHYGRQLDSAGWKRQGPPGGAGSWIRTDSTGKQFVTLITVSASATSPDCRLATMRVMEVRP